MKRTIILFIGIWVSYLQSQAQPLFSDSAVADINQIKATMNVHGDYWHVNSGSVFYNACEFPAYSGKHIASGGGLWMGGIAGGNLLGAATAYRTSGAEYWPGPYVSTGQSYMQAATWARIWKVNKTDIQSYLAQPTHTVSNTPTQILEWPAKGNPYAKGKSGAVLIITTDMAPFVDANNDGFYNPLLGDYPLIKGDQMLWHVFNDNGPLPHGEFTQSSSAGLEVQASCYGYSTGDLANVLFYEFRIANHGQSLDSFVVGWFSDIDLGNPLNDYTGFDSARNMLFVYNGQQNDGTGTFAYQDSIPTVGIRFLEYNGKKCNELGTLGSFMNLSNQFQTRLPTTTLEMYRTLNHTWSDGSPLRAPFNDTVVMQVYGDGYGGFGQPVRYLYDQRPWLNATWNECDMNNPPGDRRLITAAKPQQFTSGSTIHFSFCLLATDRIKNNGCPTYNLTALQKLSDSALQRFCSITALPNDPNKSQSLSVFPNPCDEYLTIRTSLAASVHLLVFDSRGCSVAVQIEQEKGGLRVHTGSLASGLYFGSLQSEKGVQHFRFYRQ
ncbi:MAG: T9SS type A sorting domain-containing protein [Bacteroidetes bacterium]|nr:T9SS type A sorting domain-containing protein [Bacteroidota bacterium]